MTVMAVQVPARTPARNERPGCGDGDVGAPKVSIGPKSSQTGTTHRGWT